MCPSPTHYRFPLHHNLSFLLIYLSPFTLHIRIFVFFTIAFILTYFSCFCCCNTLIKKSRLYRHTRKKWDNEIGKTERYVYVVRRYYRFIFYFFNLCIFLVPPLPSSPPPLVIVFVSSCFFPTTNLRSFLLTIHFPHSSTYSLLLFFNFVFIPPPPPIFIFLWQCYSEKSAVSIHQKNILTLEKTLMRSTRLKHIRPALTIADYCLLRMHTLSMCFCCQFLYLSWFLLIFTNFCLTSLFIVNVLY